MLTKPLNDHDCLERVLRAVQEAIRDPTVQKVAKHYGTPEAYANNLRMRPHLEDGFWYVPGAPYLACHPPARIRFDPQDPNCTERVYSWLSVAEILDPETPRTLMSMRIGRKAHVIPVVHTEGGPEPVNLDSFDFPPTDNLMYAAVAQVLGYGSEQPSPVGQAVEWAQKLAEREGVPARDGIDLLGLAERYAGIYPGGEAGLRDLAVRFADAAENPEKKRKRKKKKKKKKRKGAGGVLQKGKEIVGEAAKQYKQRPELGQLLRSAVLGYGGPFAAVAIDVVENRLNKRGYSLGSLAESKDTDVFAIT